MKFFIFFFLVFSLTTYAQKTNFKTNYKPPSQSEKLVNYGFTERDNGNYKRAILLATESITLNPTQYLAYYLRADARMFIEGYDKEQVLSDLNTCIKNNPRFAPAYSQRSVFEEHDNKVKAYDDLTDAINYADDLIQKASYYSSRGMLRIDMLDWVGALKDVNIALKLDPQNENALRSRGQIYIEQEKYDQAINDLDKAINIDPTNDAFVFYYRAIAKAKIGRTESACADFARAKELVGTAQFNETIEKYCK